MALHMDDTGELEGKAPRPIDAESVSRGSFDRLEEGQGAVTASSKRRPAHAAHAAPASDAPEPMSRRTLALVCGAAALAIVVIVVLFVSVLDAPGPSDQKTAEVEQIAVTTDQSVVLRGSTYGLAENGGKYSLVETSESGGGKSVSLGDLPGTPAGLVLYDGTLIIPENLSDGTWDLMAYTIGSGWSQMMDQQGNVTSGSGTISAAALEGTTVVLTVDNQRVEVPLVW